jgi:phospholipid/cholesterol/gamma-HCH transport system permease protein
MSRSASAPTRAAPPWRPTAPGPLASLLDWTGALWLLTVRTLRELALTGAPARETVRQMAFIGVNSLPIVLLILGFSGMVLALHTANQLKQLGLEGLIGGIVAVSAAREAAPVLTAVALSARVGSAIAAELGSMTVTEQVDAIRALGVSPVRYLVVPRLVAGVVMLPVVTLFGNLAGIFGGLVVAAASAGVHPQVYLNSVQDLLQPRDVTLGLVKTLVFGAIIALVGCHEGLRTSGGAAGVGRATTSAVVASIVLVYVADYFMAEWMFSSSAIAYR